MIKERSSNMKKSDLTLPDIKPNILFTLQNSAEYIVSAKVIHRLYSRLEVIFESFDVSVPCNFLQFMDRKHNQFKSNMAIDVD